MNLVIFRLVMAGILDKLYQKSSFTDKICQFLADLGIVLAQRVLTFLGG